MFITRTDGKLYMSAYMYSLRNGPANPIGRWDAVETQ